MKKEKIFKIIDNIMKRLLYFLNKVKIKLFLIIIGIVLTSAIIIWTIINIVNSKTTIITYEQALKIAFEKTGGGTVIESSQKLSWTEKLYEIKILYDKYEYHIEIDARNGNIVDFEREAVRTY